MWAKTENAGVKLNKYWSIIVCVNIDFEALEALEAYRGRGAVLAHQQRFSNLDS